MNISIYSYEQERSHLKDLLESQCQRQHRRPVLRFFENYDSFIQNLPQGRCDLVIVARDGADGMEGARAAKDLLPKVPLVWFSDDNGFGPQSYRMGCAYFAARPITDDLVARAIARCDRRGTPQRSGWEEVQ